ncbi:sulfotransferase [Catalinimonas sp. 4WD22]|uniref:sulfotransferase n=1 Tax=Catalinimonas locisalis TaxID=3133978 RepID=UPI003100C8E9
MRILRKLFRYLGLNFLGHVSDESEKSEKSILPPLTYKNDIIKSIHHVDNASLETFFATYPPVFILNTGRSGSQFLQNVFQLSSHCAAYHEAFPNLMYLSNFAYQNASNHELLKSIFLSARLEMMLEACVKQKVFIETNHCLTFYAYQIADLMKGAKFVHITRHPATFVRSGIMKGWHKNDTIWEMGRVKLNDAERWEKMSQIERLSWTWNATHHFIEDFKKTISVERVLSLKIEDLVKDTDKVNQLLQFTGGDIVDEATVKKIQSEKVNQVKKDDDPSNLYKLTQYPHFNEWNDIDKAELRTHTLALANSYGYQLS